jgi:hypothetical protein
MPLEGKFLLIALVIVRITALVIVRITLNVIVLSLLLTDLISNSHGHSKKFRHVVSLGRNGHPTSVLLEIRQIGQLHEVNFDWWGIF